MLDAASAAFLNLSTQTGARAATTAVFARCVAFASAVVPVTHPPHVNPTIANAMAPPTTPHMAGFVSTGNCMTCLSMDSENRQSRGDEIDSGPRGAESMHSG